MTIEGSAIGAEMARESLIVLFGLVIGKLLSFIIQVVLGRYLGPSNYGMYVLAFSIFEIGRMTALMGLPIGIVRYGSETGEISRVAETLKSAIFISTCSSVFVAILLILVSPFLSSIFFGGTLILMVIFALSLPFSVLIEVLSAGIRATRKMFLDVLLKYIGLSLGNLLILTLFFGLLGNRPSIAVLAFAVTSVLIASLYLIVVRKKILIYNTRTFDRKVLARYSVVVFMTGFVAQLTFLSSKFLLGMFRSSQEVGIFNASFVIALQIQLIPLAVSAIMAPTLSSAYHQRKDNVGRIIGLGIKWNYFLSIPFLIILLFYYPYLVLLFGPTFTRDDLVFSLIATGILLSCSGGPISDLIKMSDHQNFDLFSTTAGLTFGMFLGFQLIPHYGALGGAISFFLSLCVTHIIQIGAVSRISNLRSSFSKVPHCFILGALSYLVFLKLGRNSLELQSILTNGVILLLFYIIPAIYLVLNDQERKTLWFTTKQILKVTKITRDHQSK